MKKLSNEERAQLKEDIALAKAGTKFTTKAVLKWLERLESLDANEETTFDPDSRVFFMKGGRL